jgi:hypothetical protein
MFKVEIFTNGNVWTTQKMEKFILRNLKPEISPNDRFFDDHAVIF